MLGRLACTNTSKDEKEPVYREGWLSRRTDPWGSCSSGLGRWLCRRRGLVQVEPVASHILNGAPELLMPNRLLNAAVGAELVALCQLAGIGGRCEHDDGNQTGPRVRSHSP